MADSACGKFNVDTNFTGLNVIVSDIVKTIRTEIAIRLCISGIGKNVVFFTTSEAVCRPRADVISKVVFSTYCAEELAFIRIGPILGKVYITLWSFRNFGKWRDCWSGGIYLMILEP